MPVSIVSSSTIRLLALILLSVVVRYTTAESLIPAESLIGKALETGQFGILNVTMHSYGDIPTLITSLGGIKVTIFGPTDASLIAAGITNGTEIEGEVIMRHAVLGELSTTGILQRAANTTSPGCLEIASLAYEGVTLVIEIQGDGAIAVNGVSVNKTLADITGDEGVFHGIDGIIPVEYPACPTMPPSADPTKAPTSAPKEEAAAADSASSFQRTMPSSLVLLFAVASSIFMP